MPEHTLIHGLHAVETALKHDAQNIHQLWADTQSRNKRLQAVLSLAKKAGVTARYADSRQLEKLARTHRHQNIVAEYAAVSGFQEDYLADILAKTGSTPLFLVLDGVTDPHNLGACLRTAEGAGVDAVIVPKNNSVGLTPTVRKVASGAAELVPLIQVTNLARTLDAMKKQGVWVIGTSDKTEHDLYALDFTLPLALVLGAEGKGIRSLTAQHCDMLVKLPMAGKISSLNVSVATGICLYEAVRQRR